MEFAWNPAVPNRCSILLMTPMMMKKSKKESLMFPYKLAIKDVMLVLAGGAIGSVLRYYVSLITHYQTSSPFPYKTLIVNIIGCFLVGFITMRFQHNSNYQLIRLFFITGFMGAFTTFSTFSYETVLLYQDGHVKTALMNIIASTVTGLIAVVSGLWLGHTVR